MGKNNSKENNLLKLTEYVFVEIAKNNGSMTKEKLNISLKGKLPSSQLTYILSILQNDERIEMKNNTYSISKENIATGVVTSHNGKHYVSFEGELFNIPANLEVKKGQQVDFTMYSLNSNQQAPVILNVYDYELKDEEQHGLVSAKVCEEHYAKINGADNRSNNKKYKDELENLSTTPKNPPTHYESNYITDDPDGEKCDKDDGMKAEIDENGNHIVKICIANVPEAVDVNSEIFRYAYEQGQTLYGQTLNKDMYDKKISHGLCSLDKNEPKSCIVFKFTLNKDTGNLIDFDFYRSLVTVSHNFSYEDNEATLNAHPEYTLEYIEKKLKNNEELNPIENLAAVKLFMQPIIDERQRNQLVRNVDSGELKVNYSSDYTKVESLENKIRYPYEDVVEAAMILVNENLGKYAFLNKVPFIYRTHDKPTETKVNFIKEMLQTHNIPYDGDLTSPEGINELFDYVLPHTVLKPYANELKTRLMSKAHFSSTPDPQGITPANSLLKSLISEPGKGEIYNELLSRFNSHPENLKTEKLPKVVLDAMNSAFKGTKFEKDFNNIYDDLVLSASNDKDFDEKTFNNVIEIANSIFFNKNIDKNIDKKDLIEAMRNINLYDKFDTDTVEKINSSIVELSKSNSRHKNNNTVSLKDIEYGTLMQMLFTDCPEITGLIQDKNLKLDSSFDINGNISQKLKEKLRDYPMYVSHTGLSLPTYSQDTAPIRRICDYFNLINAIYYSQTNKILFEGSHLEIVAQHANECEKNEIDFTRKSEDIAMSIYLHQPENLNRVLKGHVLTYTRANRYKGVYDIFALVENKEEGIKIRVPLYELLKNKKYDPNEVRFSLAGTAIVDSKNRVLSSVCDSVDFKIAGSNYNKILNNVDIYPEAYGSTNLLKTFTGDDALEELEFLNNELYRLRGEKPKTHGNPKSSHNEFNQSAKHHSKHKTTSEDKKRKSEKQKYEEKRKKQHHHEASRTINDYLGKISEDDLIDDTLPDND